MKHRTKLRRKTASPESLTPAQLHKWLRRAEDRIVRQQRRLHEVLNEITVLRHLLIPILTPTEAKQ